MIDLKETLRLHNLWLDGSPDGVRAHLQGANLRSADLRVANLRSADLRVANLPGADLRGAIFQGANLQGANLRGANLRGADLQGADLRGANLRGADLPGANLQGAILQGANLRGTTLQGADLRGADLPYFQVCPEEGDFIGWKKVRDNTILKLLIPAAAKRTSSLVGRKCRAEFVVVLEGEGVSTHDGMTRYYPGDTVYPDKYDGDIRVECTNGIHFFITKREAEEY